MNVPQAWVGAAGQHAGWREGGEGGHTSSGACGPQSIPQPCGPRTPARPTGCAMRRAAHIHRAQSMACGSARTSSGVMAAAVLIACGEEWVHAIFLSGHVRQIRQISLGFVKAKQVVLFFLSAAPRSRQTVHTVCFAAAPACLTPPSAQFGQIGGRKTCRIVQLHCPSTVQKYATTHLLYPLSLRSAGCHDRPCQPRRLRRHAPACAVLN